MHHLRMLSCSLAVLLVTSPLLAEDAGNKKEVKPAQKVVKPKVLNKKAVKVRSIRVPALKVVPAQPAVKNAPAQVAPKQAEVKKEEVNQLLNPTHKQTRVINPTLDGKPITLNTFCLDAAGQIWACCGGSTMVYSTDKNGRRTGRMVKQNNVVQIYTHDGALKKSVPVEFAGTAINVSPDGHVYAAGSGKIAKFSADGKLLGTFDSPHIGNIEEFKKKAEEEAKAQSERLVKIYQDRLDQMTTQLENLEKVAEKERTDLQKAQIEALTRQQKLYENQVKIMKDRTNQPYNVGSAMTQKLLINGIAITKESVFLSCATLQGYGYDVWRTDLEFKNPKMVISKLRGCCGRMDLQAFGENLVLAENTKFKVGIYNIDGKPAGSFGDRDRTGKNGFGSCCNPMNCRYCANGDILTAESSVGHIKRFTPDGKLVAYIGRAKIGGGCKNVAIGFDETRNRFYMMNVEKNHICVLVPLSEAPEFTEEEIAAKEAREGLGKKLVGTWEQVKKDKPVAQPNGFVYVRPGSGPILQFHADGSLLTPTKPVAKTKGVVRRVATPVTTFQWQCVSQKDKTLTISILRDQIEYSQKQVEFLSDDEVKVSDVIRGNVYSTEIYTRSKQTETKATEAGE